MKTVFSLLAAAICFALTACFEHHAVISLEKDGSGTITEETVFGAEAVTMMEQMAAMGAGAGDPLGDLADRAAAEKRAKAFGEGVTVEKVEAIDQGGRKGARVVYVFEDINKIGYAFGQSVTDMQAGMQPGGAAPDEKPVVRAKFEYADGVLTVGQPPKRDVPDDDAAAVEEMDEASLMMAREMLGDMQLTMKLEFPGGIEETNATYVDGNTVTLADMKMGALLEDPEKFKEFVRAQPETPAEMRELMKGVEGVKMETREQLRIELK